MPDDKTLRTPADRSRVALEEDYEVAYWTGRFGVSRARLATAIKKVGHGAAEIERFLRD